MSSGSGARRRSIWIAVGVLIVAGGVWAYQALRDTSDPAVWGIAADQGVSADSTGFTANVYRVGCNSGIDGEPVAPRLELGDAKIVITFEVTPHSSGGDCQGTMGVMYEVDLGEPIGDRTIVDGECHEGSEALSTVYCLEGGVRWDSGVVPLS